MNLLGVDYGTKHIGLAKVNTDVSVVLPFGIIENLDQAATIAELVQLVQREKIDTIVVGLPFSFNGAENKNTSRIREFFDKVHKEHAVAIDFLTEVFSSQASDRMGAGVSRDEKAAMIILQNYLDAKNK